MASYRVGNQLPSMSDITKADDIELQEIAKNPLKSIENLNQQVQEEPTEDLPMGSHSDPGPVWPLCKLLGLDKQLRSIRGSLKDEVAKRFSWKNKS